MSYNSVNEESKFIRSKKIILASTHMITMTTRVSKKQNIEKDEKEKNHVFLKY